ncbi:MAG: hypothetical protein KatS3mg035_0580 [Bacteroidia bacterium]|nr:MAG: hypothetical protein KatS3mg035_0580 [Bacteroidia bacterium]
MANRIFNYQKPIFFGIIRYELSYPNYEVEQSLNQELIQYFAENSHLEVHNIEYETVVSLQDGN